MITVKGTGSPRTALVALIVAFAAAYAAAMTVFDSQRPSPQTEAVAASGTAGVTSSADVPGDVIDALKVQFLNLPDLEEWVVLPDEQGGYTVSATVQLLAHDPYHRGDDVIARDVKTFFTDVYGSGVDIADAKIYFLQAGQLIGGAGLGAAAYRQISVETSTTGQDFVNLLSTRTTAVSDGPQECWFATRADGSEGM
jgi:hypothetical protein